MLTPQEEQLRHSLGQLGQQLLWVDNIGITGDNRDLYYLIDFFTFLVDQTYPEIPCPTGCSLCCVDSGLPRTSSLEWRMIYAYLLRMPEETWQRVKAQNAAFHGEQMHLFLQEQQRIAAPDSDIPLPEFGCKACPFLLDGRCSIYEVRPAICRGYGYFTWRRKGLQEESQVFACRMAADALFEALKSRGSEQAVLPVWNRVTDLIYALEQDQGTNTFATLPLWLFVHTAREGNERLNDLDLTPDFEDYLSKANASTPE